MPLFRRLCLTATPALLLLPATGAHAATTTANVFVVPSGGSGSCARVATPVAYGSAPAGAKCASVQAAVNAMAGGDTALMEPGSYSDVTVAGVTRSPAVTVKVESGGTATLSGGISFGSGANGVILDGTQGAGGKGFSTTSGVSFGSNGGALTQNVKLSGVSIHDGSGGQMIWMVGCSNVTVSHVEIARIAHADGIQMAKYTNQPECSNVTFDDIYMHDFDADCGVDHQDGIQIRAGSNITFTNSKIVDLENCGSQGFFANQEGDLGGSNTTLSNTVISGINGSAVNFSSKPPQRMINNTIDGGLNTCQPVTSTCTGVVMKNNILNSPCAGQKLLHDRVQSSADWANNVSSYNCGYSAQGDTVVSNFAGLFVNPTSPTYDFHLKAGAAAIGKANRSDYTRTDFDGLARDSAPDAGADEYGNTSTTPPPASTDTTAPNTAIISGPASSTSATSASFGFNGSDNVTAQTALTFECRLDAGAWAACTTPKAYSGLASGSHTFSVRARDAAGNVDPTPATQTWTVTATPAPSGLVAAYGFNETSGTTAADRSGNGLTATLSGPAHTTAGRFGAALSFDGVNDLVTVADTAKLDLAGGATLEAWVRPTSTTGWRTVITKEGTGKTAYGLYAGTDADRPSAHVNTGASQESRGTAQLPANAWHHLAATYDGATLRLYLDGAQVSARAVTGSILTTTGALRIGGTTLFSKWFAGLIDEVRIYDRALGATEIQGDMTRAI